VRKIASFAFPTTPSRGQSRRKENDGKGRASWVFGGEWRRNFCWLALWFLSNHIIFRVPLLRTSQRDSVSFVLLQPARSAHSLPTIVFRYMRGSAKVFRCRLLRFCRVFGKLSAAAPRCLASRGQRRRKEVVTAEFVRFWGFRGSGVGIELNSRLIAIEQPNATYSFLANRTTNRPASGRSLTNTHKASFCFPHGQNAFSASPQAGPDKLKRPYTGLYYMFWHPQESSSGLASTTVG